MQDGPTWMVVDFNSELRRFYSDAYIHPFHFSCPYSQILVITIMYDIVLESEVKEHLQ